MLPLKRGNRAIGTKYQEIVRLFNLHALKIILHKHVSSGKSLIKIVRSLSKAQAGANRKVSSSQLLFVKKRAFSGSAVTTNVSQHNVIPRPVIIQWSSLEGPPGQFLGQPAVHNRATVYQSYSRHIPSHSVTFWISSRMEIPVSLLQTSYSVCLLSQWITFSLIFDQILACCNLCPLPLFGSAQWRDKNLFLFH